MSRANRHIQIAASEGRQIKGGKPSIIQNPTPLHFQAHPSYFVDCYQIKVDTICQFHYLATQLTASTLSMSSNHFDESSTQGICDAAAIKPQWGVTPPSPLDLGSPQPPRQPASLPSTSCCECLLTLNGILARPAHRLSCLPPPGRAGKRGEGGWCACP